MTNELEKQFFQCFGIEPKEEKYCLWECRIPELEHVPCSKECKHQRHDIYYPEITDRHYLELICIQNKFSHPYSFYGETLEFLKDDILRLFIEIEEFFRENELTEYESFKSQVRTLFEEG